MYIVLIIIYVHNYIIFIATLLLCVKFRIYRPVYNFPISARYIISLSSYLPSGACHEGCPILCFPSSGLRHLVDDAGWEDFDTTITYMKSLLK